MLFLRVRWLKLKNKSKWKYLTLKLTFQNDIKWGNVKSSQHKNVPDVR